MLLGRAILWNVVIIYYYFGITYTNDWCWVQVFFRNLPNLNDSSFSYYLKILKPLKESIILVYNSK